MHYPIFIHLYIFMIHVFTRFSIYTPPTSTSTHIFELQHDPHYLTRLMDPIRLQRKQAIFRQITLPCMLQQTDVQWNWHIGYSPDYYPMHLLQPLIEECTHLDSSLNRIHWIPVVSMQAFYQYGRNIAKQSNTFATIRLDDDDGLGPTYLSTIRHEFHQHGQTWKVAGTSHALYLSFANPSSSFSSLVSQIRIQTQPSYWYASGLCAFYPTWIHDVGNHTLCWSRYPLKQERGHLSEILYVFCDAMICDTRRSLSKQDIVIPFALSESDSDSSSTNML